ncbi:hypothetical protein R6Q57_002056 [Mikania cordata]
MVGWAHQRISIEEEEKKTLLEIKSSLVEFSKSYNGVENLLPSWVVNDGSNYCDWERINCNSTSSSVGDNYKYVTDLYLGNMFSKKEGDSYSRIIWPLNISLFIHFKELRRLDLSSNYIGNTFLVTTGLEKLSGLKNLETLNLSRNFIETNNIFPSLSQLASLNVLDLSLNRGGSLLHGKGTDISKFLIPKNMEVLDLTACDFYGTLQIQGTYMCEVIIKMTLMTSPSMPCGNDSSCITTFIKMMLSKDQSISWIGFNMTVYGSIACAQGRSFVLMYCHAIKYFDLSSGSVTATTLRKLKILNLGENRFNESLLSSLSDLISLKSLDLHDNLFSGSFPFQEISHLINLEKLDLSWNNMTVTPSIQGTLSNLVHLNLDFNNFFSVDDVMRSMATAFPSLRFLSLYECFVGGRLFANEVPDLPYLKVLILGQNNFNGTLPIEALASFHHLEILDLSYNNFSGSIPSRINQLSSLNGSLTNDEFCKLKNLHELDLSYNMFDGKLPECFNRLSSLKLFDISSNKLTGVIPSSLIINLTSLEYVDFSHNKFEGSFSFSWFSNHTKLEYVAFSSDNDMFEVETEEAIGWTCMFQLEVLILSSCNINRDKGSVIPSFLLHQHELRELDISHNSFEGQFPLWLIKNNTMLQILILGDNSFGGTLSASSYRNTNIKWLDVSRNHLIGPIPNDIKESFPFILHLNLSRNSIDGVIPSSIGDLSALREIDLSHNRFYGEVPTGLLTNFTFLSLLILSNNSLHGEILSRNFNISFIAGLQWLQLDRNCFTGKIGNMSAFDGLDILDISDNFFTGLIPDDRNKISMLPPFLWFLDLSKNLFSGPIPFSYNNFKMTKHIHLDSNKFSGSIPNYFRNLTEVLTLDIGNNYLSGRIPNFLGELSNLRILLLGKNNFNGSIPRQLCHLTNATLIDLSNNLLSGSIPRCLQNIARPSCQAFMQDSYFSYSLHYRSILEIQIHGNIYKFIQILSKSPQIGGIRDKVLFTTKSLTLQYKGDALDTMSGLDLSCNKLTGNIPEELGLLAHIHVLNLSHNWLTGPIPVKFSNLANLESLDLSFNSLTGKVPSELIKLNYLAVFNVSFNNLSGRLPEFKAQFSTFTNESYKGNTLLCGPPLENECIMESHGTQPSNEERSDEKWYDMDMASLHGSCTSTWLMFMLGFAVVLYVNPYWRRWWFHLVEEILFMLGFVVVLYVNHYWRRWWFHLVEESMYTCFYFIYDLAIKV